MTKNIEVLVVEDEEHQVETYQDWAESYEENGLKIKLTLKKSPTEAKDALLSTDFDAAIVDLNLSKDDPEESSGNQILREILHNHRFPILVVSGNLGNLSVDIHKKRSGFLKLFDRDTPNDQIFEFIINTFKTGITNILGGRGEIEKRLSEIFWRHLAIDFDHWDAGSLDSETTLLRYTVAHLSEYLDVPNGDDYFYHEAEFYIKPPIKDHIASGDIISLNEEHYVLLEPPCDVAVRGFSDNGAPIINTDRLMIAPLISVSREAFIQNKIISETDNTRTRERKLEEIIKGNRPKFIFFPQYGDIESSVADLQNIESWSFEDYQKATRIATVSNWFLKNILSRFSAYYGRQGQPDLNNDALLKSNKPKL